MKFIFSFLTKLLWKQRFHEIFAKKDWGERERGKTRNYLSLIKKIVKSTILSNHYFHEIFAKKEWDRICAISTLCCGNWICSLFLNKNSVKSIFSLKRVLLQNDFTKVFLKLFFIFHTESLQCNIRNCRYWQEDI